MKRVIVAILLIAVLLVTFVSAASSQDIIIEKTGINPDNFKDPQQLKEEYLKQNWAELIAKNRILGPIHNFLLKMSPVFVVLFGAPYTLSLVFLVLVILWFTTVRDAYMLMWGTSFNGITKLALGIGATVIIAQIGWLGAVSRFFVNLALAPEAWWMRLIIMLTIIVAVFIINYGVKMVSQIEKKSKEKKRELTAKETLAESKAFIKGVKEGQSVVKD